MRGETPFNPDLPGYNPNEQRQEIPQEDVKPEREETPREKEISPEVAESHEQLQAAIEQFREGTGFEIKREDGKEVLVSREGERFFVSELTDPSDPAVKEARSLLMEEFGRDMVEPMNWWKQAITEGLYRYNVIKNESGKIVSVSVVQPLEGGNKGTMFAEWFVYTDPNVKNSAELSRHVLASSCESGLADLRQSGTKFRGFVGESVSDMETRENDGMHKKRMFIETADGGVKEVPYEYPPSEFDSKTGKEDSDTGPARLMVRMVDGSNEMSSEDLLKMVDSMYKEYVGTANDYNDLEAYGRAQIYVDLMLAKLRDAISEAKGNRIFFMSGSEISARKEEVESAGRKFIEVEPEE